MTLQEGRKVVIKWGTVCW